MRRFWLVAGSLFTVLALVGGTAQAVDVLAREDVTETTSFDAAGISLLAVRTYNGRVEVVGSSGDRIEVVASVTHGLFRTRNRMTVSGSRIELGAECPGFGFWCGITYRVTVPHHITVDVDARNADIRLSGLTGTVRARGDNGEIVVDRLGGETDLETRNGPVRGSRLRAATVRAESRNGDVSLSFAAPPTSVTAVTRNGDVDVTLPGTSPAYRLDVATANGSTDLKIRTDPESPRTITATTDVGDVRLHYP